MAKTTQKASQARDTHVIAGIGKHLQTESNLTLLGAAYTPATLTAAYQGQLTALIGLASLKAQVKDAVAQAQAQETQLAALTGALKSYIINAFGESVTVLGDFGFTPKKVAQKDPVTKVVAAARMRSTREERGTKGPVQKKAIKGSIPATLELSTATGETSAPAAAPSTSQPALQPQGTAAKAGAT